MAILSGDSTVGINISTSANTSGIDDTASSLSGLSTKAVALGSMLGSLAATGVIKLVDGLREIGTEAITSSGDFEQSRIAFETMLGSADKARKMMQDISDFAKSTPFELPELVKSSKQLLAFGFAQEDIIPTMRKLGDIASGVGVPVGQLAYVFGQVRVAGKLMGGDLMQFTNAGVPMIEGLSKVLKVSQGDVKDMVEKGKVGFKEVQQVIDNMSGSGSKFGGMMDKQSQSFNGVVSNIKDGFGQMLRSAVGMSNTGDIVKGGFFDKIKDGAFAAMNAMNKIDFKVVSDGMVGVINASINLAKKAYDLGTQVGTYLSPHFSALWKTIQTDLLPVLVRLWKEVLEPLMPVIGVTLVAALGLAIDAARFLIDGFSGIMKAILDGNPVIWGLIGVLGTLGTAMALQAGLAAFKNAVGAMMTQWATLSGVVATPMVMPAIAVGAAIAALMLVYDAANKAHQAINEAQAANDSAHNSNMATLKMAQAKRKSGEWSEAQYQRVVKSMSGYASGGFTGRGGINEVAGIVHKGEYVIPQSQVDQSTGQPKSTHTVTIQNVYLGTQSAAQEFFKQLDNDSLLVGKGMTPVQGRL